MMQPKTFIYRVEAPHFVAGFIVKGERVKTTAPIISRFKGKSIDWVRSYCRDHNWKCLLVQSSATP